MRRLCLIGILLLAGCESVRGPLQPRPYGRADDPSYSIREQEIRGRESYALPVDSAGPSAGFTRGLNSQ